MALNIKHKRSAVPGKVPTVEQLELGQFGINTHDGKAFIKKDVGGVESVVMVGDQTQEILEATRGTLKPSLFVGANDNNYTLIIGQAADMGKNYIILPDTTGVTIYGDGLPANGVIGFKNRADVAIDVTLDTNNQQTVYTLSPDDQLYFSVIDGLWHESGTPLVPKVRRCEVKNNTVEGSYSTTIDPLLSSFYRFKCDMVSDLTITVPMGPRGEAIEMSVLMVGKLLNDAYPTWSGVSMSERKAGATAAHPANVMGTNYTLYKLIWTGYEWIGFVDIAE